MSLAGQLPITHFLNLLSALGTRMAPQYQPWSVAAASLRHMQQLFAQAGLIKSGWHKCSTLLQRYASTKLAGQYLQGVQLKANGPHGLNFQVCAVGVLLHSDDVE
jgi:hypothetical protein